MNTHSNLSYRTSQVNHAGDSTSSSTTDSAPALALVAGSAPISSPQQRCGSDNFPLTSTPSIQVSSISDSVFLRTMLMIESALDCDICSGMMVLGSDRMALARSLILLWREHGRPEQASWLDRPDVLELGDLRSLFPFRDISWSDFNDIIFGRTSQVNHAGDSIPQTPKHDTGVGSGVWLGDFLGPLCIAVIIISGACTIHFTSERVRIEQEAAAAYHAEFERMRSTLEQWSQQQSRPSAKASPGRLSQTTEMPAEW